MPTTESAEPVCYVLYRREHRKGAVAQGGDDRDAGAR
jgi:hypothetical protein